VSSRPLDERRSDEEYPVNFMYQSTVSGRTGEPEVPAQEHRATLEERILRLQYLVSCLLAKNERLRQQLAARREEESELTGHIRGLRWQSCSPTIPHEMR
jgi:hypothetical protein